jgi:hypothetical protein
VLSSELQGDDMIVGVQLSSEGWRQGSHACRCTSVHGRRKPGSFRRSLADCGDRSLTLIAEANQIKMLTHAPPPSRPRVFVSGVLSIAIYSSASLPCFWAASALFRAQWRTKGGRKRGEEPWNMTRIFFILSLPNLPGRAALLWVFQLERLSHLSHK